MIDYQNFNLIIYCWISIAVITFIYLFRVTAPYGRHTSNKWGPVIGNRTGWFIMEFFVLVTLWFFLLSGDGDLSVPAAVFAACFTLHYLNRSIVFPLRMKKGAPMPVSIMLMAMCFNLVNGFLIGYYLGNFERYTLSWLSDPRFIAGVIIFFAGMAINWYSDIQLIRLRKPGETGYKIPYGGLFRFISCPNLFGEIVEWLGFALMMWNLPGLTFFIWTFANLVPRAVAHHKWYLEKFHDYPSARKAVFPFIW